MRIEHRDGSSMIWLGRGCSAIPVAEYIIGYSVMHSALLVTHLSAVFDNCGNLMILLFASGNYCISLSLKYNTITETPKRRNKSLSCCQFSEFPLYCILSKYSVVSVISLSLLLLFFFLLYFYCRSLFDPWLYVEHLASTLKLLLYTIGSIEPAVARHLVFPVWI